jgi:hypothetical protein
MNLFLAMLKNKKSGGKSLPIIDPHIKSEKK